MNNEVINSILYDIKRHPFGYVIGGVGAFIVVRKSMGQKMIVPLTIGTIMGAIAGRFISSLFTKTNTQQ